MADPNCLWFTRRVWNQFRVQAKPDCGC